MESKFIPNPDALKSTNWRKPEIDKQNSRNLILLIVSIGLLAVVFIPWFCIGIDIETLGSVKLRAFGFQTWYGIVGAVAALVAVIGVLYKHYSLTLCSSVLALLISFFALSDYPTSRVCIDASDKLEMAANEAKAIAKQADCYRDYESRSYNRQMAQLATALEAYDELPNIKIPGQLVELAAVWFELVDQRFVYEALEKSGAEIEMKSELGEVTLINHRLGALLFLLFSVVSAILSYVAIVRCGRKE